MLSGIVIVDTSVWIDYLGDVANRHTVWLDRELTRQRFSITDLILCEVLQGIRQDAAFFQVRRDLARCELFPCGGEELAVASAQNYRLLRAQGRTVRKTIDCLIATFCMAERHSLLHRDRDFDVLNSISDSA